MHSELPKPILAEVREITWCVRNNQLPLFLISLSELICFNDFCLVSPRLAWKHTGKINLTFRVTATSFNLRVVDAEHPPPGISHIRLCRQVNNLMGTRPGDTKKSSTVTSIKARLWIKGALTSLYMIDCMVDGCSVGQLAYRSFHRSAGQSLGLSKSFCRFIGRSVSQWSVLIGCSGLICPVGGRVRLGPVGWLIRRMGYRSLCYRLNGW